MHVEWSEIVIEHVPLDTIDVLKELSSVTFPRTLCGFWKFDCFGTVSDFGDVSFQFAWRLMSCIQF